MAKKKSGKRQKGIFIESESMPSEDQEDGYLEFRLGNRVMRLDFRLTMKEDDDE